MCIRQGVLELQCVGIAKCWICSLLKLLCLRCCDVRGWQLVEVMVSGIWGMLCVRIAVWELHSVGVLVRGIMVFRRCAV